MTNREMKRDERKRQQERHREARFLLSSLIPYHLISSVGPNGTDYEVNGRMK